MNVAAITGASRALGDLWRYLGVHPLTRDRRLAAAWRVARWQIENRLREEVVMPWVGGARLAVRRGMTGATGNLYCGLHEFAEMAFALHWLRSGDLFVDGGANIGSYTVLAAAVRRARVVAFEPVPETVARFRRNIELNGIGGSVELRQAALAEAPGRIAFTADADTMNRRLDGAAGALQVRAERLDDALAGQVPTMVKLDLEGDEAMALRGAVETLRYCPAWLVEADDGAVRTVLAGAGLVPHRYDPFARTLSGATSGPNLIWLRDPPAAEARLRAGPAFIVLGRRI
jgi:FkbM family methyltransferase